MQCTEHPKYTGQRKPRTECKGCWELYNNNHGVTKTKQVRAKAVKASSPSGKNKKEQTTSAPPVITWNDRRERILKDYKNIAIVGRKPDRLLAQSASQYRQEMLVVMQQLFPDYVVAINYDGTQINMLSREIAMYGVNTWKIDGKNAVNSATKKAEALERCRKEEITINHGDFFYSEKMKTPIIVVSYNDEKETVMIKEWHTHELVIVPLKEFHKLELREVVADDDFTPELKLKSKVLVY